MIRQDIRLPGGRLGTRAPLGQAGLPMRRTALVAALLSCAGAVSAQSQAPTIPKIVDVEGGSPQAPGGDLVAPAALPGGANAAISSAPVANGGSNAVAAPSVPPRSWVIEPSIITRVTSTNNALLEANGRSDTYLEVRPSLDFRSNGPRHHLKAMVGANYVDYTRDSYPRRKDPLANLALNTVLVQNALFLDAGGSVDLRSASPYGAQANDSTNPGQKVRTQAWNLSPYLQMAPAEGYKASLRSDNIWTRTSGAGINSALIGSNIDKSYSRNTLGRLEREPRPFGVGLELGEQMVRYNDFDNVLQLQNALLSLSYAIDPQFTLSVLGGAERNRFASVPGGPVTSQTDSDAGMRLRWTPLERSTLTAEARRRFFGNSYNVEWNHRSPFLGLRVSATREPYSAPKTMLLNGDVATQFDAIFRSRGFDTAQRDQLVNDTLKAYNLKSTLDGPVNLLVNRAQLASTANVELALLGRRTVTVLSAYTRRLEQLRRADEPPAAFSIFDLADLKQTGWRAAVTFRLTPVVSLETDYRYDRAQGLGINSQQVTKGSLLLLGTGLSLSARTRVILGAQYQELDTTTGGTDKSVHATSATVGMTHRF